MKMILTVAACLIGAMGSSSALAASSDAHDVRSAVYCLTHGDNPMLPNVPDKKYAVTFTYDDRTFSGEHDLLLFIKRERDRYDAFVIAVSGHTYDVRNNATLKNGRERTRYVADPLGGIWTHDYIAGGFAEALKRGPVMIAGDPAPVPRPVCRQFGKSVETR